MNSNETQVAAETTTARLCIGDERGPFLRLQAADLVAAEDLASDVLRDLWAFDPFQEQDGAEVWVTFETVPSNRAFGRLVSELQRLSKHHGFEFSSWE